MAVWQARAARDSPSAAMVRSTSLSNATMRTAKTVMVAMNKDASGTCILRVPATFRDFDNTHPSFSNKAACNAQKVVTGLVKGSLVNGVPAANGGRFCTGQVAEWYTDGPKSTNFQSEVVLYDNGNGLYTNHWGANGEKWVARIRRHWKCGKAPWKCGPYLGSPFFFPVDGIEGARTKGGYGQAGYSGAYGSDGTVIWENNLLMRRALMRVWLFLETMTFGCS